MSRSVLAAFLAGCVVASAATAGATKLITGKDIKDGTISQKDLSKAIRKELRKVGPRGPQGLPGAKGDQGPKGDTGATGAPPAPEPTHLLDLTNSTLSAAGHDDPSYYRDPGGVVHLAGFIHAHTTIGAGDSWAMLPAGYRPAANRDFFSNSYPNRLVYVDSTGKVASYTIASSGDNMTLDEVQFRCAPSGADGCP